MKQVNDKLNCGIAFCGSLAFFKTSDGIPLCGTCAMAFEIGRDNPDMLLADIPRNNFNRLIKTKNRKGRQFGEVVK
jgi:hypothetical protein